jgi:hypothetical protein
MNHHFFILSQFFLNDINTNNSQFLTCFKFPLYERAILVKYMGGTMDGTCIPFSQARGPANNLIFLKYYI